MFMGILYWPHKPPGPNVDDVHGEEGWTTYNETQVIPTYNRKVDDLINA